MNSSRWRLLAGVALLWSCAYTSASERPDVTVAPVVSQQVRFSQPVEALVLLHDPLMPLQAVQQRAPLQTLDRLEYGQYLSRRIESLNHLKTGVFGSVAGPDLDLLTDYSALPVLHVRLRSQDALERLSRHPLVRSIDENRANSLYLAQSLPLVRQPQALAAGHGGAGTTVCVVDTGTDYTRTAFGPCTAPNTPAGTCKVVHAQDFAPDDGQLDSHGHGTNVAATVLGVAPESRIAALDVFSADGLAYSNHIIAAINWCITNRAEYNIAAINMSLGGGRYFGPVSPTDSWGTAITNAIHSGITVVSPSGNHGYLDSIGLPAAYSNVVSVGATYDSNMGAIHWTGCSDFTTAADRVTCFSNSASFLTMLAPGAVISAGGYAMGGTSMAAPHVAGAAAVLRATYPAETVSQHVVRLKQGQGVTDHRNSLVKTRLDLVDALSAEAPAPPALFNISTRAGSSTGSATLIGGFVIRGNTPKQVLIRARGPSLAISGVANAMADPTLSLYSGTAHIGFNDNWREGGQEAEIIATGRAPQHDSEAALVAMLAPGAYTVHIRDAYDAAGTALFEVLAVGEGDGSRLFNVSTRAHVGTDDAAMIGGFVVQGEGTTRVLIRARGPSLASAGVSDALADPMVELFSGSQAIAINDDWRYGSQQGAIEATGRAPTHDLESALLVDLIAGPYTAIVRGYGGATGIGIIEVIAVDEDGSN